MRGGSPEARRRPWGTRASDSRRTSPSTKAQALAGSSDTDQAQRQALAYLDAAIALDPTYADAHATRALRVEEIAGQADCDPEPGGPGAA